jgi:DNA-binding transcriptional LysR family regulator
VTDEFHYLRAFVAVAEDLSFRRAAERMNVAQPALTRAVRTLEQHLGCQLLRRTTRRVDLTQAGSVFLAEARLAIAHADKAVAFAREAAKGKRGHLSVAYTYSSISGLVPEIVTKFRLLNPDATLTLQEMWSGQQASALMERRVDVGFAMPAVIRPEFNHRTIKREPFVAVLPENHALAKKQELELKDLRDEPFVMGAWETWRHYREMINEMCVSIADFVPNVVQEEIESHVILGLVAAHVGVTIYPECIRNYHRFGIAIRPFVGSLPLVETIAAWHKENESEIVRNFVRTIDEIITEPTPHPEPSSIDTSPTGRRQYGSRNAHLAGSTAGRRVRRRLSR